MRQETGLSLVANQLPKLSNESESGAKPSFDCDRCSDIGRVSQLEEIDGHSYHVSRDCECLVRRRRKERLTRMPKHFAGVELASIKADAGIHPKQAEVLKFVKDNPESSYYFAGKFGTGKSLLMWALYRHAVMQDRERIVVCTLSELLGEYRSFIQASSGGSDKRVFPRVVAEQLRQSHTRYSIFFDDLDKAKPTEYAAEQLFELANAIYDFEHQLVVTTNLAVQDLIAHYERADDRFGGAIVRRLTHHAQIVELF